MKKPTQEFVLSGGKVLAIPLPAEPLNRLTPRYMYGIWLGVRSSNSAECCILSAEGTFRSWEIRRLDRHHKWDEETINSIICVLSRFVD